MALDFTVLETELNELDTVVESVIAFIKTVAEDARNLEANKAKIKAFADRLDARAATLAASIVASTPAANEPAPTTPVADIVPIADVIVTQ